jgi:3-isopropylmalate/(R)-2-methylmalate dehydratase small subunit
VAIVRAFTSHRGLVAPLDRANVDTDAILPKQFLKSIHKSGFGPHLFDGWRYLDHGQLGMQACTRPVNPDFVLNQPRYAGASILLTGRNFGAGSSREHAQWALQEFGFRVLVAPSFADIFLENCMRNGLAAITLPEPVVDLLFNSVQAQIGYQLQVDLGSQTVMTPQGETITFPFDPYFKGRLLAGVDDIDETLAYADEIRRFEQQRFERNPWLAGTRIIS